MKHRWLPGGQGGEPEATDVVCEIRLDDKGKGWEVVDEEKLQEGPK